MNLSLGVFMKSSSDRSYISAWTVSGRLRPRFGERDFRASWHTLVFYAFSCSVWAKCDPLRRMFVMSGGKGGQKECDKSLLDPLPTPQLRPPAVGITRCPSCYCRGWSAPGWWPCAFSTVSWFSRRLNLGPEVCCTRRRPRYPSSPSSSPSLSRASSWPWPFLLRVSSAIWFFCSETKPVEEGERSAQMLNRSRNDTSHQRPKGRQQIRSIISDSLQQVEIILDTLNEQQQQQQQLLTIATTTVIIIIIIMRMII